MPHRGCGLLLAWAARGRRGAATVPVSGRRGAAPVAVGVGGDTAEGTTSSEGRGTTEGDKAGGGGGNLAGGGKGQAGGGGKGLTDEVGPAAVRQPEPSLRLGTPFSPDANKVESHSLVSSGPACGWAVAFRV